MAEGRARVSLRGKTGTIGVEDIERGMKEVMVIKLNAKLDAR